MSTIHPAPAVTPSVDSDEQLIANLVTAPDRLPRIGKFSTVHRKTVPRPIMMRDPNDEMGLLDGTSSKKGLLNNIDSWDFDVFALDTLTNGHPLPALCLHIFDQFKLLQNFKIDPLCALKFFSLAEQGYHNFNPFHNAVHAADVTQAIYCFLREKNRITELLTPLEKMACIISALVHDIDHPGVNQKFLISTNNYIARLFQRRSVLENHHCNYAIAILHESGFADQMGNLWPELRRQIVSLVLATDVANHQIFLNAFKSIRTSDLKMASQRHLVMQMAMKCADISNPSRSWKLCRRWSMSVSDEFFLQGDLERRLGMPVSYMCDRLSSSIPRIQLGFGPRVDRPGQVAGPALAGFFDYMVIPLLREWNDFFNSHVTKVMIENVHNNYSIWRNLLHQEDPFIEKYLIRNPNATGRTKLDEKILCKRFSGAISHVKRYKTPANGANQGDGRPSTSAVDSPPPGKLPSRGLRVDDIFTFRDTRFLFFWSVRLGIRERQRVLGLDHATLEERLVPEHRISTLTDLEESNRIRLSHLGVTPEMRRRPYTALSTEPPRVDERNLSFNADSVADTGETAADSSNYAEPIGPISLQDEIRQQLEESVPPNHRERRASEPASYEGHKDAASLFPSASQPALVPPGHKVYVGAYIWSLIRFGLRAKFVSEASLANNPMPIRLMSKTSLGEGDGNDFLGFDSGWRFDPRDENRDDDENGGGINRQD